MAEADARELDRRLLHLELVVARLAEQVKALTEEARELRHLVHRQPQHEVGRDV